MMRAVLFGPSMWPFVWSGARLPIERCDVESLVEGDLAAVRTNLGVLIHRVVRDGNLLRTRGDFRTLSDPPITSDRLVGRVRGFAMARWALPTPRWLTVRLNAGALRLHPLFVRIRERRTILRLRRVRDRVACSPIGGIVRGRGEPKLRVLEKCDETLLRRATWSRGKYDPELHETLRTLLHRSSVLGAVSGNRLLGQLVLRGTEDPNVLLASDFWVDPWWRGRGLGRQLAQLAIEHARARDAGVMRTIVQKGSSSHALFRRLGFTRMSQQDELVTLELTLDSRDRASRARHEQAEEL